ncbi:hypothetical protein Tco_1145895 [Tanacetum coccineum]
MRMRQYSRHTDHNLWDVIVNGDLEEEPEPTGETSDPPAPKTAKQLAAKRNQERVRALALAIPDEYLLKHFDEIDIDDLYNNLMVYEDEMKRSSSSTPTSQNFAFLSSENTSSTNKLTLSLHNQQPVLNLRIMIVSMIIGDDLEDLDLRWQEAYVTVKSGRNQGRRSYGDNGRSNAPTNESSSQPLNFDSEREKHSRARLEIQGYELALESLESRILVHEKNELAWDGYHAVPPPITGNFLTPRADITFACLDEYAIKKKIIKSKTTNLNTKTSETVGKTNEVNTQKPKTVYESVNRDKVIIEDWNSGDEDDVSEVQTVSPVKTNES